MTAEGGERRLRIGKHSLAPCVALKDTPSDNAGSFLLFKAEYRSLAFTPARLLDLQSEPRFNFTAEGGHRQAQPLQGGEPVTSALFY